MLLTLLLLLSFSTLAAQTIGVGYYDLDGLYDTIPSRFYDDSAYTPRGRREWSGERYRNKIERVAAVVDSMSLPIIGLYGVENESVVRDLVMASSQDYSYIHRTRNSFDGADFTLLYYGDRLFVERVVPLRNMLVVEATLEDDSPLTIILSRSGDDTYEYLRDKGRDSLVVVLGALSQKEISRLGYTNPLRVSERRGEGNYFATRGWVMHDRVGVSSSDKILKSGVYITPWLLDPSTFAPLATYDRYNYLGGYSKFLPIFVYIYL